ncbi:MAG: hypothetical protein ACI91F_002865 [Candidatus Binatia bacterium]
MPLPMSAPKPVVVEKPKPKPAPKPVVVEKPKPKPAPKPVVVEKPKPTPQPAVADAPEPLDPLGLLDEDSPETSESKFSVEVPETGTVVTASEISRWQHLLPPSIQWALNRGASIKVGEHTLVSPQLARAQATERYSAQVRLSDDKKELLNYVAGIPFPNVEEKDPDLAVKLIHNFAWRISVDDLDVRNFSCQTGNISSTNGLTVERHYLNAHFHRLYYRGRLYVDPKPTLKNPDGINYREALHPIIEPFDLKGAGFSYNRYIDPARQDDSWLYFPQMKRVRRLSTSARSEGIFGQDIDLDSYGGFAGQPAWSDWSYLGTKTVLAPANIKTLPVPWQKSPANFMVADIWEPREVYMIEARSLLPGYTFSKRVIYIDRETFFILYTESYDLKGQLWKAFVQAWKTSEADIPGVAASGQSHPIFVIPAFSMFDMQVDHATRCSLPAQDPVGSAGWFFDYGDQEGTVDSVFDVSTFISEGR